MRLVMIFSVSFVMSCAAANSPYVASSLPAVDPMTAIVAIPPGACLGLDDHYAISTDGVRVLIASRIQKDTEHRIAIERCSGDKQILAARAESAEKRAVSNEAWATWAPLGIAGAFIAGIIGGVIAAVVAGR